MKKTDYTNTIYYKPQNLRPHTILCLSHKHTIAQESSHSKPDQIKRVLIVLTRAISDSRLGSASASFLPVTGKSDRADAVEHALPAQSTDRFIYTNCASRTKTTIMHCSKRTVPNRFYPQYFPNTVYT